MNICCKYSKLVPVAEVKDHPRNPNRHNVMQIALLAEVIRLNGWRRPIVVSNLSGFVTKGHGRLEAAKKLGITEVPVEFQDYASEAEEMADMLADNRIAELAHVDEAGLNAILAEIKDSDLPIVAAGFREADFLDTEDDDEPAASTPSASRASPVQKGTIGQYKFTYSVEEQNAWLADIYAKVGQDEAAVIAEVKRRLGL